MSVLGGTRVPYGLAVAVKSVDRQAWAALVQAILDTDFAGNQSRFATAAQVTSKTVGRWLKQEHDVSEQSVREIARRLDRDPMDWLVKVGYYTQAEANRRTGAPLQSNVGQFVIERMAALGIPNADVLAAEADVPVDDVMRLIFDRSFTLGDAEIARLANALQVPSGDLAAAASGRLRGGLSINIQMDEQLQMLAEMVSDESPLTDSERRSLRTLVDAAMQPYREKYGDELGARRAC